MCDGNALFGQWDIDKWVLLRVLVAIDPFTYERLVLLAELSQWDV